jgi:hypothetical protein
VFPEGSRAPCRRHESRCSEPRHALARGWVLALCAALASWPGHAKAADPERVQWSEDWRRVSLVEGLSIIPLGATMLGFALGVKAPSRPSWRGGILFDDWARDGLRGRTASTQRTMTGVGDVLYMGVGPGLLVADLWVVTLGIHESSDVAGQMALIDLESLGGAGVLSLGAEHTVGRARPYTEDCGPDGRVRDASGRLLANHCGSRNDNMSFFAGHPAAVATMAGLTCAHHQHLPLYGGGVADLVPCVLMIGAAGATGVSRVVGDKHWASDVLLGWTVGALSGYVLPSLLHYGFTSGRPVGEVRTANLLAVPVPQAYPGGAGLGLVGFF